MKSLIISLICLTLLGCETRRVEFVRPDGAWAKYTRTTLMGDSSTEGVVVTKQGDDLHLEVGSSGSQTAVEAAVEAYGVGVEVGRRQAGEDQ